MTKRHAFIILIIINTIISCTNNDSYKDADSFSYSDFGNSISLHGTIIEFDDILMKPVDIRVSDSLLIMKNRGPEYHFHIFSFHDYKKKGELISFGNGPNEMIEPTILFSDDSFIWVLDHEKRSVSKCSFNILSDTSYVNILQKTELKEYIDKAAVLKDGGIISVALNPQMKRFSIFDNTGQIINNVGEYPECSLNFKMHEQFEAFFCDFTIDYKKQRIFMSYKQTDLIEISNLEGQLIKRMHGPDHFFPIVKQEQNGDYIKVRSQPGKTKDAYFIPRNAGDEVFVLYSGEVYERGKSELINTIFVFDWNGIPKRKYELDNPIYSFDVDQKNRVIYALSDSPEYHAIKYHY